MSENISKIYNLLPCVRYIYHIQYLHPCSRMYDQIGPHLPACNPSESFANCLEMVLCQARSSQSVSQSPGLPRAPLAEPEI